MASTQSPSRYTKRAAVFALTLTGLVIAATLAAYQLRLAPLPPDPIFGSGSARVLDSPLSRWLPIPDAALGAAAYATEALLVLIGRNDRFATAPWLVLAYAALASVMGFAGVGLTIYQAVLEAGCSLCLASALLSLLLVPPALFEARAAVTHLRLPAKTRGNADIGTSS